MKVCMYRWGFLGFFLSTTAVAAFGDTLEEVEKKVIAAARKVTSVQGKMTTKMEMMAPGYETVSDTKGTVAYVRKGEKTLYRMQMETSSKTKMGDQEMKQESTSLMICDGEIIYTLSDTAGQKTVTKIKATPEELGFKAMRANADLKLLPDDKVDDKPVYVIESTPKGQSGAGKTLSYYQQDTGFMVKSVSFSPDGRPLSTTMFTDLKFDEKLSADQFEFKVPAGVQVIDMTEQTP